MPAWFDTDVTADKPSMQADTMVEFISVIVEVVGVMLDELDCRRSSGPSKASNAAFRIPWSKFLRHLMPRGLNCISFAEVKSDRSNSAAEAMAVTRMAGD